MSQSASILPDTAPTTESSVLERLPDILVAGKNCSPHIQQQLDLLLLAIEALELGASEKMLAAIAKLELNNIISGRIALWRLRCSNPWRRSYTRNFLTSKQAKALLVLAALRAKDLEPLIRHLVDAEQLMRSRQLPIGNHFRLSDYLERFRAHFRSRMNSRRTKVAQYITTEAELNDLALGLLRKLLFLAGSRGLERVWSSLFDGEV